MKKKTIRLEPKASAEELKLRQKQVVALYGTRMREARELNNLTQQKAAEKFGYANSSKLAKIENASDTNSFPLWIIPAAADIYGVSIDFLFGKSDDWERDATVCQERDLSNALMAHWERARASELNAIRVLNNKLTSLSRGVSFSLDKAKQLKDLVNKVIDLNQPTDESEGWDGIRYGNKLLNFAIEVAEEAMGIRAELIRYKAYVDVADKSANSPVNADIFTDIEAPGTDA